MPFTITSRLAFCFFLASAALMFDLPSLGAETARIQETIRVRVGPLSIEVPSSWQRRDGPSEDNPHYDAPADPPGSGPTVAISIDEEALFNAGPGMTVTSHSPVVADGQKTEIFEWTSEEDDTRGLTVPLTDGSGRHYHVTGWTPAAAWKEREAEIRSVIDTIAFADRTETDPAALSLGPVRKYDFGNRFAVTNGPKASYEITFDKAVLLRKLRTYHWNNGRGAAPGTLSLKDRDGNALGPWAAGGEPGMGGVPNAYWVAEPGIVLQPGTYTIATSKDRTWSTNNDAGGRGFFYIEWQEVLGGPQSGKSMAAVAAGGQQTAESPTKQAGSQAVEDRSGKGKDGAKSSNGSTLFAGELGSRWNKLSIAGGDFDKFARIEDSVLAVSVPEGSGWGKTGIWSKDPLFPFPEAGRPSVTLTWAFDATRTTSFAVALGARADADEWAAHEIRVMWTLDEKGTSATLSLHVRQQLAMSAVVPAEAPDQLSLTLNGDGSVSAVLPQGNHVEAVVPQDMLGKPLHVYALAHPRAAHASAEMALKSIAFAVAAQPMNAESDDLFSGMLGSRWRPLSLAGGDFNRFARLTSDGLIVDVPKDSGWGKTGLYSSARILKPNTTDTAIAVETMRFELDPAETTSFVIAAGPKDGPDEWSSHDVRFAWSRSADGKSGLASASMQQQPSGQVETGPEAPAFIDVTVRGDGVASMVLPGGECLEVFVPDGFSKDGLRLFVLAHAPGANNPAKLSLRRISNKHSEIPRTLPVVTYPDTRERIVLFDGTLGTSWAPFSAEGGDFMKHGRIGPNGIAVAVPPQNGWGKAGIGSREPVVWLRSFNGPAETSVDFSIDASTSDGFRLSLIGPGSAPASAYFQWRRKADGSGALVEFDVSDRMSPDAWVAEVPAAAPPVVRFHIKPGSLALEVSGIERAVLPWPAAHDGVGFNVVAHAFAIEANAPVHFGLKRVELSRKDGALSAEPKPAPGVAPLKAQILFSGEANETWKPVGLSGAEFQAHAKFDNSKLVIAVPPEQFDWGRVGLLSEKPVAHLDERIERTAMRLRLKFDRAATTGLSVVLSYEKVADMWPRRTSAVSLIRAENGPSAGFYLLQVHSNPGTMTIAVDPSWLESTWDGTLNIILGKDWLAAQLGSGPLVRVDGARPSDYVLVTSHPQHARGGSKMALSSISRDWIMPDGMTAQDRWLYIDSDEFDADNFWNEAAGTPQRSDVNKHEAVKP